jgi:formamidopyrimidine-DNA glycosylase
LPELPEVETIVRALRDGGRGGEPLPGRQILGARISWERTLAEPKAAQFLARITGQTVRSVERRGKFLLLPLTNDSLLIHLRMSGDLRVDIVQEGAEEENLKPHDRVLIWLQDGLRLAFNDPRKFGRMWLVADSAEVLANLGPEPLSESLTAETFHQRLVSKKRQLKPLLLDQSFLAGMGNIYTDEALHMARLHPLMSSDTLNVEQAEVLLNAIRNVLKEGIRRNGASIDWVYRGGEFQNDFRVYQRTGEACQVCGQIVQRILVGQRGTHFCPTCQPFEGQR